MACMSWNPNSPKTTVRNIGKSNQWVTVFPVRIKAEQKLKKAFYKKSPNARGRNPITWKTTTKLLYLIISGTNGAMLRAEEAPSIGDGYSLPRIKSKRNRLGWIFNSSASLNKKAVRSIWWKIPAGLGTLPHTIPLCVSGWRRYAGLITARSANPAGIKHGIHHPALPWHSWEPLKAVLPSPAYIIPSLLYSQ